MDSGVAADSLRGDDVFLGASGGEHDYAHHTFQAGVGGTLPYTYADVLTETYGVVAISEAAALSVNANTSGTFDGTYQTFSVAGYTAGDSGYQAFQRTENYEDAGVALVKNARGQKTKTGVKAMGNQDMEGVGGSKECRHGGCWWPRFGGFWSSARGAGAWVG